MRDPSFEPIAGPNGNIVRTPHSVDDQPENDEASEFGFRAEEAIDELLVRRCQEVDAVAARRSDGSDHAQIGPSPIHIDWCRQLLEFQ